VVVRGNASGTALVTKQRIPGWGGINPLDGTIIEVGHELCGVSIKDMVLVFQGAKGSSGWSAMFHTCRLRNTAPKALIFNEMSTKVALGAVVMRIPAMTELELDPIKLIRTGDYVQVNADTGIVLLQKRSNYFDEHSTKIEE
jgi:predicted aconitase with swiveling domain